MARPYLEGESLLGTDARAVAFSGSLHQWQGLGERHLRPIVYSSKKMNATQAKSGTPKLKMFAADLFIVKNHIHLWSQKGGQKHFVLA